MPTNIHEHPEAPDIEELHNFIVEPVPPAEIQDHLDDGRVLVEDNLVERDDLDIRIPLHRASDGREMQADIGTFLYRYVQLFGTPNVPGYTAGEDISWRTNETFKYLLKVTPESAADDEDLPDEWLMTLCDWKVGLGVGFAEWADDEDADVEAGEYTALTTLRLAHNIGSEPVQCEFEDIWY